MYGCAVTGLGVIENKANLKSGEKILILGVGGVGNIVQGANMRNAIEIIVVDVHNNRLDLAKSLEQL